MSMRPLIEQTCVLVMAYVAGNSIPAQELPALIEHIHETIAGLRSGRTGTPARSRPTTASIAASVEDDHLVSFIDGKRYKTLKRHLTAHGLTPERYRSLYGLSRDYPMVSPSYAAIRSRIATQIGLERMAI